MTAIEEYTISGSSSSPDPRSSSDGGAKGSLPSLMALVLLRLSSLPIKLLLLPREEARSPENPDEREDPWCTTAERPSLPRE